MKLKKFNEMSNNRLTVADLSQDQKEYLISGDYSRPAENGLLYISEETEYVEYGDIIHTITFEYQPENAIYELYILWENGPGTWSWDGDNNEGLIPELTFISSASEPKKSIVPTGYIAIMKHESSSEGTLSTYEECVELTHEYFLSYDFEVKDGKPYDSGHETGDDVETEPFDCFDDVKMHNGKVAQFVHCGGDGPVVEIRKNV